MNSFTVDTSSVNTLTNSGDAGDLPSRFTRLAAWVRASVWTSILVRVAFFAGGLLLLAWVGRVATAATPPPPQAAVTVDAGAAAPASSVVQEASASQAVVPVVSAPAATVAPASSPPPSHARATADDPVFLNRADASELRRLPGVGAKRAEAIVALRQRVGRFQRPEDLLRVKGVGRATLKKWRPLMRLDLPQQAAGDGGAQ